MYYCQCVHMSVHGCRGQKRHPIARSGVLGIVSYLIWVLVPELRPSGRLTSTLHL